MTANTTPIHLGEGDRTICGLPLDSIEAATLDANAFRRFTIPAAEACPECAARLAHRPVDECWCDAPRQTCAVCR